MPRSIDWLIAQGYAPGDDLRVFAYGSLMWNPGFPARQHHPVFVAGYHRRFCVHSRNYRGTEAAPGLVLGLDRGGSCHGMLFTVAATDVSAVWDYLWQREMTGTDIYHPVMIPILHDDRPVRALAFIVNPHSRDYYPGHDAHDIARIITKSKGARGCNLDYLTQTVNALDDLKIPDAALHDLLRRCRLLQHPHP